MEEYMKKIITAVACAAMIAGLAGCGGGDDRNTAVQEIPRVSPDMLISAETASAAAGNTLSLSDTGIVSEGNKLTAVYETDPVGAADGVTVSIEQFSDTLSTTEIWNEYENTRILRSDNEKIEGIGADCYVAYPYIHIYDRGCHITISAGSGSDEGQKALLTNLGTAAAVALEALIPADAVESGNVIQ